MVLRRSARGTFLALSAAQKQTAIEALKNPSLITLSQVALRAQISKSAIIALNKRERIRPVGNSIAQRAVKQPKLHARLVERERRIVSFIHDEVSRGKSLSVNLLRERFGGEKKAIKLILQREIDILKSKGKVVRRITPTDPRGIKKNGVYTIRRK